MQLVEFGNDLVGECRIVVTVAQQQRFTDAILEAAFLIYGVADIEETMMRVEVHEDATHPAASASS